MAKPEFDIITQPLLTPDGEQIWSNLFEPMEGKIGWHTKGYVYLKEITSLVAKWAIKQSPYPIPNQLDTVIEHLHIKLIECISDLPSDNILIGGLNPLINVSAGEIEKWLYDILFNFEPVLAWNTPRNKNRVAPCNSGRPDDDFIDLDALVINVCVDTITRESENG